MSPRQSVQTAWQILKNAYSTITYQFPLLKLDARARKTRWGVLAGAAVAVVASGVVLDWTDSEVLKVVASVPITLALGVLLFFLFNLFIVSFSVYYQDYGAGRSIAVGERLDVSKVAGDVIQFVLPTGYEQVPVFYDDACYWRRPAHVADFLRWHDRDLRDAFILGRGPLDRPKLALSSFAVAPEDSTRLDASQPLILGGCSYFDKFCLHDSAQRRLSQVAMHTRGIRATTIARAYEKPAREWLMRELGTGKGKIVPPPFLPNALGISGLLRVAHAGEYWWYLQERGGIELADRGLLDNTFAGLVEIEHLLNGCALTLEDVFRHEMEDEVARNEWREYWEVAAIKVDARILVFEPDRLYQPEFIALCTKGEALAQRPRAFTSRGTTIYPIRQAHLLDTLGRIGAGKRVDLGLGPRTYHLKDNLMTMVSYLVTANLLTETPPPPA